MGSISANNFRFNIFWLILPVILIQRKCDTSCIPTSGCIYFAKENKFSCSETSWNEDNHTNFNRIEKERVGILEMCNLSTDNLDLSQLNEDFPNVINITVLKGNITTLNGNFLPGNKIEVLQLKELLIEEVPDNFLEPLEYLKMLDLSGNHLRDLSIKTIEEINRVFLVNLTDNHWDCSLDLEWVLELNTSVINDSEEIRCYREPYPEKPLIPVAQFKRNVKTNCPPNCLCFVSDVVRNPSNFKLEPIIEVNCSDRSLTELPSILPAQTKILMLERNNIRSLEPLIKNPIYRSIQDLYLDNNYITTIKDLELYMEGGNWLSRIRTLSLKNNRLSQLPTYALDNALPQNPNMPFALRIYLGGNPWRCDCVFTPVFQETLRKYEMQVKDIDDIKCSYLEGDDNSLALILKLSRSSVCRLPSEYSVQALDLLNGVLATLIVLILGKLAYDYYYFKKTGRLPWIVTKMP